MRADPKRPRGTCRLYSAFDWSAGVAHSADHHRNRPRQRMDLGQDPPRHHLDRENRSLVDERILLNRFGILEWGQRNDKAHFCDRYHIAG
jgi:hypothetical protein